MRKHIIIAIVIVAGLTAAALGLIKRYPAKAQRGVPAQASESLREKAKRQRQVVAEANPANFKRYDDVASLANDSSVVIIGLVNSHTSSLLPPLEHFIVTDYQVSVLEVRKGSLQPGFQVTVREPGGLVKFDDGSTAQVNLPYYWKSPQPGKRYVMFLTARRGGEYVLTGGPQGLFEIARGDTIIPQARSEDKLTQTYNGRSKASFIHEMQKRKDQG